MGLCLSVDQKESNQKSAQIDKIIDEDHKRLKKECKILLLGSGESGKSTIVKQMKIIHQNGYTKEELENFKTTVHHNLLDSITDIAFALVRFKLEVEPKSQPHVQFLLTRPTFATSLAHLPPIETTEVPPIIIHQASNSSIHSTGPLSHHSSSGKSRTEIGRLGSEEILKPTVDPRWFAIMAGIWADPATATLIDVHGSKFYLMDSAPYFFNALTRIGDPNYVPNEDDALRARVKSTGISETRFTMGQLHIHMFDVGGQRSERKKWIHCFEAVTSIIFCVGLSEYDQVLLEESSQNRMAESLVLFESVVNSRWFLRTSIVLFLNKIDLFKVKLHKIPLEKYFPEYKGGPDINKAAKYILWRFTQTNRAKLNIYPHLTQATDTSNIRLVFAAVKETILQNALKDSGII